MGRSLVAWPGAFVAGGLSLLACQLFDVAPPSAAATDDAGLVPDAGPAAQPGFVPVETAVRACSKLVGCPSNVAQSAHASLAISLDATSFTHCVDALAGPVDPDRLRAVTTERLACVAASRTCGEAAACMLYHFDSPPDPRCATVPADPGVACVEDGGAALFCSSAASSILVDCANPAFPKGSHCRLFPAERRALCVIDTPCPPGPQCNGDVHDACTAGGDHQILDCGPTGQRCVPNQGCAGESCRDLTETTCASGTRMAVCGLVTATSVDCAHIGARCIKSNTTVACARDGDECNVFDDPRDERCVDGSTIRLCVGGKVSTFDCSRVGLRCVSPAGIRSSYCGP